MDEKTSRLWCEKHAPQKCSDVAGNPDALARVKKWALEWERGQVQKPLCLWGPPGSGKSAIAHAVASEFGWSLIEFTPYGASDFEAWKKSLSAALSASGLFGSRQLVLLEAVDSWSHSGFRGSVSAAAAMLRSVGVPAIMAATDWYDRSLLPLRSLAEPVQMKGVNSGDIEKVLLRLSQSEGSCLATDALRTIARSANGDLRAAINDLQAANMSSSREQPAQTFAIIRSVLRAHDYKSAKAVPLGDLSVRDTLKLYVLENAPAEFSDATDLARALSRLSRADVFDGRIRRRQYWGCLRYSSDLLAWGLASERAHPSPAFVPYAYPSYIQKMGATKARRAAQRTAAAKLAVRLHTTSSKAHSFFPLLAAMADAEAIAVHFGFEEEEITAITGKSPAALSKKTAPSRAKKKAPAA